MIYFPSDFVTVATTIRISDPQLGTPPPRRGRGGWGDIRDSDGRAVCQTLTRLDNDPFACGDPAQDLDEPAHFPAHLDKSQLGPVALGDEHPCDAGLVPHGGGGDEDAGPRGRQLNPGGGEESGLEQSAGIGNQGLHDQGPRIRPQGRPDIGNGACEGAIRMRLDGKADLLSLLDGGDGRLGHGQLDPQGIHPHQGDQLVALLSVPADVDVLLRHLPAVGRPDHRVLQGLARHGHPRLLCLEGLEELADLVDG